MGGNNYKILVVASRGEKNILVKSQVDTLSNESFHFDFFELKSGFINYLSSIPKLRKYIKNFDYDIIHAHYVLSGWVTVLTFTKTPIILSLMGDDVYGEFTDKGKRKVISIFLMIFTQLIQPFVSQIIVKSPNLFKYILFKRKTHIIPNGVNLNYFKLIAKSRARELLGIDKNSRIVLFLADLKEKRKNYSLAKEAVNLLEDVKIVTPYPLKHSDVVLYLNALDILIHTSTMEGSPNLIKEAMACNCPIVSTAVGDVRWVIGNTEGCYITTFDSKDVASKLKLALKFAESKGRTEGRTRIIELGLDSETIAQKIRNIYLRVLENN